MAISDRGSSVGSAVTAFTMATDFANPDNSALSDRMLGETAANAFSSKSSMTEAEVRSRALSLLTTLTICRATARATGTG